MIRIGIIGTGTIAREHADAIAALGRRAALVAASDTDTGRLRQFCDTYRVARAYHDAGKLIADSNIDLVAVATPPSAHESAVLPALEAGKYVLCEKPLAHTLASARRIVEAAARRPGRMSVSYQLRYEPSHRQLSWLTRNGWLGEVRHAIVERHGSIPHVEHGKTGWWGAWRVAGGGVLMTQLIHEVDLLIAALGRPVSVSAIMDTRYTDIESEDYLDATFRFANGAKARCVASVNSGLSSGRFAIAGQAGTAELPWSFSSTDPSHGARALAALHQALPETRQPSTAFATRAIRSVARRLGVASAASPSAHARLYMDIADRIARGQALPIPPEDAIESLELCMAAYESAIYGREVQLAVVTSSPIREGVTLQQYQARVRPSRPASSNPAKRNRKKPKAIRVGLVGLDTSHAPTFARLLHDPDDPQHIPGARVVAAYPGGSADMDISSSRVSGFTAELKGMGVPIVDTPQQVVDASDLVLVLSCDGRTHPALVHTVAGGGKPVFVDKPFAISGTHARAMFDVAEQTGTKLFASSAFRYADGLVSALNMIHSSGERVRSCRIRCWLPIEETQGRYFWYGIHASEMLAAIMGPDAREVHATGDAQEDTISVRHGDGRESTIVGSRSDGTFHVSLDLGSRRVDVDLGSSLGSLPARILRAVLDQLTDGEYPRLWRATAVGSVSGRPDRRLDPDRAETIAVIQLVDAAQRSHASGQWTTV